MIFVFQCEYLKKTLKIFCARLRRRILDERILESRNFSRADGWLKNILYAASTPDVVGIGGAGFPRFSPVREDYCFGLCA